jgi:hypothetical protein
VEDDPKFLENAIEGPWGGWRVTPCEASAIVGTYSRELRDLRLDTRPTQGRGCDTRFEQNGRVAASGTDDMETMTAHVKEEPRGRKPPAIAVLPRPLIKGT